ncbi:hypothetical protein QTO30_02045 [Yoonia sp. GPGPB17]|uniref:hypothetical protein n=1 Tax=Yoonia sp. GPGPB17 TaxID=3026147 RepID=UPI0030C02479
MPRLIKHRAIAIGMSCLMVTPVASQEVSPLEAFTEAKCLSFAGDPSAHLVNDNGQSAVSVLLTEAILRHCAARGYASMPERHDGNSTRSAEVPIDLDADEKERLDRESRYYLETSMQIDADAANDLLRRLLGSLPVPQEE